MTVVITTNEPEDIKKLFRPDSIEIPMNFDLLLYTKSGTIPIERKAIPGDLLSSVEDGRLHREMTAMRDESAINILLLHGDFVYQKDGTLWGKKGRSWTKKGIRNLLRTVQFVEGLYIEQAHSDQELVEIVNELQEYFDNQSHLGLKRRPGLQSDWFVTTREDKVCYFYSGLPSVSAVRAKALCEKFPDPIMLYQASIEDIRQIDGFGKKMSEQVFRFLREG
jgi:ERCC4-type nuclease